MKRFIVMLSFVSIMLSSLFCAVQEYDIGNGQTLFLNEDGTYEIISSEIDSDEIVGKQYKLDFTRSIDPLITLVMMEEPSAAILGRDFYYDLLAEMGILDMLKEEIPDFSCIFISSDKALFTITGEDPIEVDYHISASRNIYVKNGYDEINLGILSGDYSEIKLTSAEFPLYLVRQ